MEMHHLQVGIVHIFLYPSNDVCKIVLKSPKYKHTVVHNEECLNDSKIWAVKLSLRLGLVSVQEAEEVLKLLNK